MHSVKTPVPDDALADYPFQWFVDLLSDRFQSEGLVRRVVEAVLEDQQRLLAVARRSYTHELLFDKIMLSPAREDRCVLRLHVWWPCNDAEAAEIDIHNHGRDFAARLLVGAYTHQLWTWSPSGEFYRRYRYRARDGGLGASLEPHGAGMLALEASHTVQAGNWYLLKATSLHRLVPDWERLTCSLVVQAPTRSRVSSVYSKATKATDTVATKPMMREARLRRVLEVIAAVLDLEPSDRCAYRP